MIIKQSTLVHSIKCLSSVLGVLSIVEHAPIKTGHSTVCFIHLVIINGKKALMHLPPLNWVNFVHIFKLPANYLQGQITFFFLSLSF